jgi:hypothetical protein
MSVSKIMLIFAAFLDDIICRIKETERKAANGSQRGEQLQTVKG